MTKAEIEKYEKDKWISVEDRLPKRVMGNYTVCLENDAIFGMSFSSMTKKWWIVGGGDEYPDNKVTHWQELPEPFKNSES